MSLTEITVIKVGSSNTIVEKSTSRIGANSYRGSEDIAKVLRPRCNQCPRLTTTSTCWGITGIGLNNGFIFSRNYIVTGDCNLFGQSFNLPTNSIKILDNPISAQE